MMGRSHIMQLASCLLLAASVSATKKVEDWNPAEYGQYWCRIHPEDCVIQMPNVDGKKGPKLPVNPVDTAPGAWEDKRATLRVFCDNNRHGDSVNAGNKFAAVSIISGIGLAGQMVELAWAKGRGNAVWAPNSECRKESGLAHVANRNLRRHAPKGGAAEQFWNGGEDGERLFRARADENGRAKFRQYVEDCDEFVWQAMVKSNRHDCRLTEVAPANNNYMNERTMDMWVIDNEANWNVAFSERFNYNGAGDAALEDIRFLNGAGESQPSHEQRPEYIIAKFLEMEGTGGDIQLRFAGRSENDPPTTIRGANIPNANTYHFKYKDFHNPKATGMMPYLNKKWVVPFTIEFTVRQTRCCQSESKFLLAKQPLPSDALLNIDADFNAYDEARFGPAINWYMWCSGTTLQASDSRNDGEDVQIMNPEKGDLYQEVDGRKTFSDYGDGVEMSDGYSDYVNAASGREMCSYEDPHHNEQYEDFRYRITVPADGSDVIGQIREPNGKEELHDIFFTTPGTIKPDTVGDYGNWDIEYDDMMGGTGTNSVRAKTDVRRVPNRFKKGDELYFMIGPNGQEDGARGLYHTKGKTDKEVEDFSRFPPVWEGTDYMEYSDYDGDGKPDIGIELVDFTGENL